MLIDKKSFMDDVKKIPGVGDKTAVDLWNLGIRRTSDLEDKDPEELYLQLCTLQDTEVDRCMLYVFRCAVYYASHDEHDPELLKWWKWKDLEK